MSDNMETLKLALEKSGAILMKHYGRLEGFDKKSEIDLVTVADRESEKVIISTILSRFPTDEILAEESGLGKGTQGNRRWIIDPLDGTTNFAHTFPMFSISIALEQAGRIVCAGITNPYYKECFLAEAGSGATLNDVPIKVSAAKTLAESLVVTGFPYDRRERVDHYLSGWKQFLQKAHGVLRLGSAALDLCSVACGRLDAFWEEKLNPWDTAAGWLIVEEAGGKVTDYANVPYNAYGKSILASNGLIHEECVEIVSGMLGYDL